MALLGSMYSGWSRANSRVASQSVSTVRKYSYCAVELSEEGVSEAKLLRETHKDDREAVDFVVCFHLRGSRCEQTIFPPSDFTSATHKEERVVVDVAKVLPARRYQRGRKRTVCN